MFQTKVFFYLHNGHLVVRLVSSGGKVSTFDVTAVKFTFLIKRSCT